MSLQCNIFCPKYTYVHTTGAIREAILRSRIPISRACHKKASQDLIFYDEPIRMDYFEVILGISTALLTYMYEPHIFNTNTNTQCTNIAENSLQIFSFLVYTTLQSFGEIQSFHFYQQYTLHIFNENSCCNFLSKYFKRCDYNLNCKKCK